MTRTASGPSCSDTTNETLYSEEPCATTRTLIFFWATAPKILAATPGVPFIPDPTTAMMQASFSATTLSTRPCPSNASCKVRTALSTSFRATTHEIVASDDPCEIIITLTLLEPTPLKMFAAAPGD